MKYTYALLAVLNFAAGVAWSQAPSETPLVQAAKNRQAAVKSVRAVLSVQETRFAKTNFELLGSTINVAEMLYGKYSKSKTFPERDVQFDETKDLFIISGEMGRFEATQSGVNALTKKVERVNTLYSDNQSIRKVMWSRADQSPKEAIGTLNISEGSFFNSEILLPITISIRGFHPTYSTYPLENFKLVDANAMIQNHRCHEYQLELSSGKFLHLWVDPERDHTIIQMDSPGTMESKSRIEIEYELQENPKIWAPQSWTIQKLDSNDRLIKQTDVTVQELEINKKDYSPAEIDIVFPEGIRVTDNRNHREYRVASDGSLILVEPFVNLNASAMALPGKSFFNRYQWAILFVSLLLFFTVSGAVYLKYRSRILKLNGIRGS